jgi:ATP-dependent exoDNAse (exonuclease V) alpha subunit
MSMDHDNLNFQLAVRFVNQTDRHLFLTGNAGTGKTTFLKYIRDNCFKKLAVVAPTGVAAINAGAVTIHSFFQLPFGAFIPVEGGQTGWESQEHSSPRFFDKETLLKNIRFNSDKRTLIRELDLLIIDEVSMVRADTMDAVDTILRHFRQEPLIPFGAVQLLYIGDLFQLPPVVPNEEWDWLKHHYKSPFFFDSWALQQAPPLCLELKKIYRQHDPAFINILNHVRFNRMTTADMHRLHENYRPGFQPATGENFITLTSHNYQADQINQAELNKLAGNLHQFEAQITGQFNEKSFPAEKILDLKEGSQIMFIKNDKGEVRRFFNGKIATIKKISGEKITVTFSGRKDDMLLEKEIWKNIRFNFNKEKNTIEEEELGSFSQYPVRLAWAITIHKSQGLTFEKAIIDAGASFAAGQVYVALSRLTSLNGLVLLSRIHPGCIDTDERVVAFNKAGILEEEKLVKQLKEDQKLAFGSALIDAFNWSRLLDCLEENIVNAEQRQIPDKPHAVKIAKEWLEKAAMQQHTAIKFTKQIRQLLLTAEQDGFQELNQRMQAANSFFTKTLLDELINPINQHMREMKKKKKVKSYLAALEELKMIICRKKQQIDQAAQTVSEIVNQDRGLPI